MFPTVGNCSGPWNSCSPIFSNLVSLADHCVGAVFYNQKEVFSADCHISARQHYTGIQPSLLVAGREPKADPLRTMSHRNGDLIWYWNIFAQRMNSRMFWNISWTSEHSSANASGKETWDVGSSARSRSMAALLPASITHVDTYHFFHEFFVLRLVSKLKLMGIKLQNTFENLSMKHTSSNLFWGLILHTNILKSARTSSGMLDLVLTPLTTPTALVHGFSETYFDALPVHHFLTKTWLSIYQFLPKQ